VANSNLPRPRPEPDVHRVLYLSRLTMDAAAMLTSTVEDILIASVTRNNRDTISGFLLCDGEAFLQVIEGPATAVEACFSRILRDPRHEDIQVRIRTEGPRLFARWSMCGLTLSDLDDSLLGVPQIDMDLWAAAPGALLQHMEGVAARYADRLDARHAALLARS
jgi:hypothetical protein